MIEETIKKLLREFKDPEYRQSWVPCPRCNTEYDLGTCKYK